MFRFTIRDVLWLMVVVGLACGWWIHLRATEQRYKETIEEVARLAQEVQSRDMLLALTVKDWERLLSELKAPPNRPVIAE